MQRKNFFTILLAVVLLFTVLPGVARAEEGDIKISTQLNFGQSHLNSDAWNRLEVAVTNGGSQDFEGTVQVGGSHQQDIFIQAGRESSLVFYLPPAQAHDYWNEHSSLITRVLDEQGNSVASLRRNIVGGSENYVAVLGGQGGDFSRVGTVLSGYRVVEMRPEYLDNILFANSISTLIISNPGGISLDSQQQTNLRYWVKSGGVLVVGSGSGWQQSAALVPEDLQPLHPQAVTTVPGEDLQSLNLPVPAQGLTTLATGQVSGRVLLGSEDIPLLVSKELGQGVVLWTGLDLEAAPLENAANFEAFWQQVYSSQRLKMPILQKDNWALNQLFNSISQDSMASVLSTSMVFALLMVYIILVGPINWLILRKIDRREWAWVTIPALALLFTAGSFAVGRIGRGEQIQYYLNQVSVHSEDLAEVQSMGGVFASRRRGITLEADVLGLASTTGGRVVGHPLRLEIPDPQLWSVQKFYAADYTELAGNFVVDAQLVSDRGEMEVQVTNESGHDLFDSYLRVGSNWFALDALSADETKAVTASPMAEIDFSSIIQHYSQSIGWFRFDQFAYQDGGMLFVGFGEDEIISMGDGPSVNLNIWTQRLEEYSVGGQGQVDIPRGILTPVVKGDVENHWEDEYHSNRQGEFELVFTLPQGLDFSQGDYSLNFNRFHSSDEGTLEVFNFAQSDWQQLAQLQQRDNNFSLPLENVEELIEEGRLRLKVSHGEHVSFNLSQIDITVEGGWAND